MKEAIYNHDPDFDGLATERLFELLARSDYGSQARAMGALARRAASEPTLIGSVIEELRRDANRNNRFMGGLSVAHVGFACMWDRGDEIVRQALRALATQWPEPDRGDLLWFMRSQGIDTSSLPS